MIHTVGDKRERLNITAVPGIRREADLRRLIIVYQAIDGIPWTEDESEAFDADAELMSRTIEEGLNKRGETVNKIPYNSQVWELNGTKIKFDMVPEELFHKARKFVLYEIVTHDWRSFATIASYLRYIMRFFTLYRDAHPHALAQYIHESDIISFLERENLSMSARVNILKSLIKFYDFWAQNYRKERLPINLDKLEQDHADLRRAYAKTHERGHFPSIPDKVFYIIHFKMMELIRNPHTPFDDAVMACFVILHMWTGLRPKEIRGLRRRCLVWKREEDKTLPFYEYLSPKNKNRVQSVLLFPAALEALKKLESLQTQRENVFITDYLVSFWRNQTNEPETYTTIENTYDSFLCRYMPSELAHPHPDLRKVVGPGPAVIYRPCLYSYRVHLCTYLIDHGYDERWVEAHLGHLSETIRGAYYRSKAWRRQETREQVSAVIPGMDEHIDMLTNELQKLRPQEEESISLTSRKHYESLINNLKQRQNGQ